MQHTAQATSWPLRQYASSGAPDSAARSECMSASRVRARGLDLVRMGVAATTLSRSQSAALQRASQFDCRDKRTSSRRCSAVRRVYGRKRSLSLSCVIAPYALGQLLHLLALLLFQTRAGRVSGLVGTDAAASRRVKHSLSSLRRTPSSPVCSGSWQLLCETPLLRH